MTSSKFKLLRYYSLASLVGILIAASALTWGHREVVRNGLMQFAQLSNIALANAMLTLVKPELISYLATVSGPDLGNNGPAALAPEVVAEIRNVMRECAVLKVKVYDPQGTVVFSSDPLQVGLEQDDNDGFLSAIGGQTAGSLIYRDKFNSFDKVTEEDNLMQTYVPLRDDSRDQIVGAFEIYTDLNPMVREYEKIAFVIMIGSIVVLGSLYSGLILVVQRAEKVIDAQQQTIRERTVTLEMLSAQMMAGEEMKKKEIATELHEGLAQTLGGIKLAIEKQNQYMKSAGSADTRYEDNVIPLLQEAIREVRTIATELSPSTLDDLGLLPTIKELCRQFAQAHPQLEIQYKFALAESLIPVPLKIVIFRTIQAALKCITLQTGDSRVVVVALQLRDDLITLAINEMPADAGHDKAFRRHSVLQASFSEAHERTTLSGGKFSTASNRLGGATLHATWPCLKDAQLMSTKLSVAGPRPLETG